VRCKRGGRCRMAVKINKFLIFLGRKARTTFLLGHLAVTRSVSLGPRFDSGWREFHTLAIAQLVEQGTVDLVLFFAAPGVLLWLLQHDVEDDSWSFSSSTSSWSSSFSCSRPPHA
jgi:hypothetical protein